MWIFNTPRRYGVELDPTEREFFINNQTDRSSALVRETIQNSLDARREDAAQVVVKFSFYEGGLFLRPDVMDRHIEGLMPHLRALETELNLDEVNFAFPRFLTIEDFGTHGLRGDPASDDKTDFYYFWRVVGRCGKGDTKAGRWGLGKTVFPNSSQISAFLGYTIPSDHCPPNLFGQAALKTHEVDGITYLPYAFYTKSKPAERELPFDDPATLGAFCRDFHVSRAKDEPGLSIIVPFPYPELTETSLIEAAILHYFFPILAGGLAVQVNQRVIDQHSIERLATELHTKRLLDAERSLAFARQIFTAGPESLFQIDFPDQLNSPAGRVPKTAFAPENLAAMRQRFNEQRLLSLRVPVEIRPKNGPALHSQFMIHLKRDPTIPHGLEYYIRGGISITGHQTFGGRQACGLLLAEDAAVSRFLGDAENPAHTAWQSTSQRLAARYRAGRDTLLFIRESMVSLVDTLLQAWEEEDPYALIEFFYTPRKRKREKPEAETPERQPVDLPPAAAQEHLEIAPLVGGFKISYSTNGQSALFPMEITVQAAYEIRLGNPFKKYHPHDFDLRRTPIVIQHKAVRNLRAAGQRLDFVAENADFEVLVTGFDPNRDLKVRADQRTESP